MAKGDTKMTEEKLIKKKYQRDIKLEKDRKIKWKKTLKNFWNFSLLLIL